MIVHDDYLLIFVFAFQIDPPIFSKLQLCFIHPQQHSTRQKILPPYSNSNPKSFWDNLNLDLENSWGFGNGCQVGGCKITIQPTRAAPVFRGFSESLQTAIEKLNQQRIVEAE